MSFERWANAHKLHAAQLDKQSAETRHGIIVSYDPVNSAVKVIVQPEGTVTGWIEVGHVAAGSTMFMVGPMPGDQVILQPQEGDGDHWTISHRVFSTVQMPPTMPSTKEPIQAGEVGAYQTTTGNYFHMANNGTIYSAGTWQHTGNLNVTGEVTRGFGTSDMATLGQHIHNQPADSAGDTEQPTDPPTPGH